MEQNRPKQTDQQATNTALAALAAAGNSFALGQLWEVNKGFVRRQLWQWYEKNKPVADNAGLSFEDLVQEGYFAVDYAAKHYSAEQGSFTTYLSYALLKQIRTATCGEHARVIATKDGRRVAVSANPLNECTSLDTPVGEDGSDTALGDLQEDPAAAHEFQQAENEIYNEELHAALEEALNKLADREAGIIRRHYYNGQSLKDIGQDIGISSNRVNQIERHGFQCLRRDTALARWRDEVISTRAWRGTGWNTWNRYGSVQERTVEYLEKKEEERFDYYAWRDQMIREHYADFEASGYFDRHPEQRPNLEPQTDPKDSTPPGGEV